MIIVWYILRKFWNYHVFLGDILAQVLVCWCLLDLVEHLHNLNMLSLGVHDSARWNSLDVSVLRNTITELRLILELNVLAILLRSNHLILVVERDGLRILDWLHLAVVWHNHILVAHWLVHVDNLPLVLWLN